MSKKFLISPPSRNGLETKFLHLLVSYGHIYEAYGHFNSWKPFVFDRSPIKDNSLFHHFIQNRSFDTYGDRFFPNFATHGDKFVLNFLNSCLISIFCEPFQSSPFYCLPNFAICILKSSPNFAICILKSTPNFAVLTKLLSSFFAAYLEYFWGIVVPTQVDVERFASRKDTVC